jgi:NADH-quinone oxidoreductase subunit G
MVSVDWNLFHLMPTASGGVGALDLGFVPGEGGRDFAGILEGAETGEVDVVFNLGVDEANLSALSKAFVVYIGTHGDKGIETADVILPGSAYTEGFGTWVSTEGRVQRGLRAVFPPGDARENWTIFRALSEVLGATLPYDNLAALRAAMANDAPHLAAVDAIASAPWAAFGKAGKTDDAAFALTIDNFYLTNPIARASKTMAECSALHLGRNVEATGTNG